MGVYLLPVLKDRLIMLVFLRPVYVCGKIHCLKNILEILLHILISLKSKNEWLGITVYFTISAVSALTFYPGGGVGSVAQRQEIPD